jgi:hypothetical protein
VQLVEQANGVSVAGIVEVSILYNIIFSPNIAPIWQIY